jgi:hypothetical protein
MSTMLVFAQKNVGKNVKVYTEYGEFAGKITWAGECLILDDHISIVCRDIAVMIVDIPEDYIEPCVGDWVEVIGASVTGIFDEVGRFYQVSKRLTCGDYELKPFYGQRAWAPRNLRKLSYCEYTMR